MMVVVPVPFSTGHPEMLQHAKSSLEDKSGLIAAHPDKFHKLVTAAYYYNTSRKHIRIRQIKDHLTIYLMLLD
jgi:hypothetical protein